MACEPAALWVRTPSGGKLRQAPESRLLPPATIIDSRIMLAPGRSGVPGSNKLVVLIK
jgi:hypothetical protein